MKKSFPILGGVLSCISQNHHVVLWNQTDGVVKVLERAAKAFKKNHGKKFLCF